jgi:hypothetical protein
VAAAPSSQAEVGTAGGTAHEAGAPEQGSHGRQRWWVVVAPSSQTDKAAFVGRQREAGVARVLEAGGVPTDGSGMGVHHSRFDFFPVSIRIGQGRGDKVH